MKKHVDKILNIFSKSFIWYNAVVLLLIIPLTILVNVTEGPIFLIFQILQLMLMLLNAIYIVFKVFLNRSSIWEKTLNE